jgi:hypothetical protein
MVVVFCSCMIMVFFCQNRRKCFFCGSRNILSLFLYIIFLERRQKSDKLFFFFLTGVFIFSLTSWICAAPRSKTGGDHDAYYFFFLGLSEFVSAA